MRGPGRPVAILVLFLCLLTLPLAPAAGAITVTGPASIVSNSPVNLSGQIELVGTDAVLHAETPRALQGTLVQAENLSVEVAWERGVEARAGQPLHRHVTGSGSSNASFSDATVRLEPRAGSPELLIFPETASSRTALSAPGTGLLDPVADETVVTVGASPDTEGTGNVPQTGFWYTFEGRGVGFEGEGEATVTGAFSLFVHDAHIEIQAENRTTWSNWTGYQEESDGAVTRYEQRVTVLRFHNATLEIPKSPSIHLLARNLSASLNGVLSTETATGEIPTSDKAILYDRAPLLLEGQGTLASAPAVSQSNQETTAIRVGIDGEFEALETSGLPVSPTSGPDGDGIRGWLDAWVVLLALVPLGVVAVRQGYPARVSAWWQHHQQDQWLSTARDHAREHRFDQAAGYYERVTSADPDHALAWYERALATYEAGRYEETLSVVQSAEVCPGIDRLDLLELGAAAAWHAGQHDRFEAKLTELHASAPRMAQGLVDDLEIDTDRLTPTLQRRVKPDDGGHLDGYA